MIEFNYNSLLENLLRVLSPLVVELVPEEGNSAITDFTVNQNRGTRYTIYRISTTNFVLVYRDKPPLPAVHLPQNLKG